MLNHVGDREGFTRTGHAQQGLVRQAVFEPFDHARDRLRLITGGLKTRCAVKGLVC